MKVQIKQSEMRVFPGNPIFFEKTLFSKERKSGFAWVKK